MVEVVLGSFPCVSRLVLGAAFLSILSVSKFQFGWKDFAGLQGFVGVLNESV